MPFVKKGVDQTTATSPGTAFQYERVYQAFRQDAEFWHHWKVVDCARCSPDSPGSAAIRVVLDLPASQRLFPTAYTPGIPTLRFDAKGSGSTRVTWVHKETLPKQEIQSLPCDDPGVRDFEDMKVWCLENPDCLGFYYNSASGSWDPKMVGGGFDERTVVYHGPGPFGSFWHFYYIQERAEGLDTWASRGIPGLPPGYSVALEVHVLEEAKIMLTHQRAFRGGKIDPEFEWLDAIVRKKDVDAAKPEPRAKRAARRKVLAAGSEQRPEAELRPPVGSLPLDSSEPGLSEGIKAYSDSYGDTQVTKHVALGRNQVYAENTLINVFGGDIRLPKREAGSWGGPVQKSAAEREQEEQEGQHLDQELDVLLKRGAGAGRGRGGGLLAGRLDR